MAVSARRIESPPTGQTIEFLTTAEESAGELLRMRVTLRPGANVPSHIHREQEEHFEVVSGQPSFKVGGRTVEPARGENLAVRPGVAHRFRNDSDADVELIAELRPALRSEELFDALYRLAREGRTLGRTGAPGPVQTARLMAEYEREFFYLSAIPVRAQRALTVLAR